MNDSPMLTALVMLHGALQEVRLPLELPETPQQRDLLAELIDQLEDYAIPRSMSVEAPLLAVVGGSTGAGKSTLVNSIVGRKVTESGVLRPTTRSPVLVHHPDDAAWFGQDRLLPELQRTDRQTHDPKALQLVAVDSIPPGLAILDAPDIDSVEEQNRTLAAQLLAAADMWLFVTSAARYADQVPWDFLKQAAERSTAVAIVLDRTPDDAVDTVEAHLARMLASRGLKDSPMFTVREGVPDADGVLPATLVSEVTTWLASLAKDADARTVVVQQTLDGAVRNLSRRSFAVSEAVAAQVEAASGLRADVDRAYDEALAAIHEASADGTLLRGEVLARWQEFVGTGELLKSLETKVGAVRDRLVNAVRGKPQQAERVTAAVESGLETLLLEHAEGAAERAAKAWRSHGAGAALLAAGDDDVSRASRDFRRRAERLVRDWQHGVLDLVRTEGADKRGTARFMAYGVNGLGVSLMVVVFASTGGLTGAEVGIAGGSAVLGQKLLEAVFGDQAVRRLIATARDDLDRRVAELMQGERARFHALLAAAPTDTTVVERLRECVRKIDDLRYAAQHRVGEHGSSF
ncbi:GTPase [Nocardioides limicola]|uniref:GTPase n=1 Tax=Nocardioides limicola TaxID=2803368 RepID=UPI001EF100CB|nr:GTPase [Nocardioides sp. DJM-14]